MKPRMTGEQRRAAIVRSAIQLFAEKGFRGATTRELAHALGVTEPVLYQHFRTKRDLYSAILESQAHEASEHAGELRALAKTDRDEEFFACLGKLVLERYRSDPELARLLLYSCLERHELAQMFYDRIFREPYRLVARYIRRRTREGAFRAVDPATAAAAAIGMFAYHGLLGVLFPDRAGKGAPRRVVTRMTSVFLDGMR
jgi:AcrR family transcriptional regulator